MNTNSQNIDPFEHLVRLTIELLKKHRHKRERLQVLCCVFTSTGGEVGNDMKFEDIIKHTHLKNISERDILNALDFLKEKDFIMWDNDDDDPPPDRNPNIPFRIVWVTYGGLRELESNIYAMEEMIS